MSVKWVVGGADSANKPKLAYSYNGTSFTNVSTTIFGTTAGVNVLAVAHSGGIWVAGVTPSAGTVSLGYSYDGITWVASANSNSIISGVRSLAYGNGRFVALGGGVAYSTNGINWTASPYPLADGWIMGLSFANPYFVVSGGNGFTATNSTIAYSTDATSWTLSNTKRLTAEARMTDSDGNGNWVAVGLNANPATQQIAYTNNITSTATAEVWTYSSLGTNLFSNRANYVKYGNGTFIVNGYDTLPVASTVKILRSTNNGVNWTIISSSNLEQTGLIYGINYCEGVWVMGQKSTTKSIIYSTDNGSSWSVATTSNTSIIHGVGRYNPYVLGSQPVINSIASGLNSLTLSFSQSSTGNPVATYYYSFDGTTKLGSGVSSSPLTITNLTNTTPYSIYIIANNSILGDISSNFVTGTTYYAGTQPLLNSVTSGLNSLTVNYNASTGGNPSANYYYCYVDSSFVAIGAFSSPFTISGLTTNVSRNVYVGARGRDALSTVIWDLSSSSISNAPYIKGSLPSLTVDSSINSLVLNIGQSTGGIPTTLTYYYSLNGAIVLIGTYVSKFTIPDLLTSASRSVYVGARGVDNLDVTWWDASSTTVSKSPYIVGSKPTITIDSSMNSLVLNIGQSTGGNPSVPTYYYYIDSSYVLIGSYVSNYTISGLTTNASRSIYVGARGYDSSTIAWDASSVIISATPYVKGSSPTLSIDSSMNSLVLNIGQSTGGNSATSSYYYLIDGSLVLIGLYVSKYTITGLTTNVNRNVYVGVRGFNGTNALIWDASSLTQTAKPYVNGSIPSLIIDSSKNSLVLNIGQSTGGNPAVSEYYYSIDSSFVSIGQYVSKYTIPELTTNASRSIYVGARGYDGASVMIWDMSSSTQISTPYVVGTNPTITLITPGINKLKVEFNGSTAANPSPTYYYSYSSDGSNRVGPVTSPFDISGISATKTVYIVANNIAGDIISAGMSGTPYTQGTLPTLSIDSSVNSLILNIGESTGGPPIDSVYYYSIDGSFVSIGSYVSKYTIPGLTTNASRSIYVGARGYDGTNTLVFDVSSLTQTAIPYVRGTPPNINTVTSGTNKITVAFDGSTGANPTPTYYYSYSSDGSNPIGPVTSPFDISNITTTQTFYIVGTNIAGTVISSVASGTPYIFGSNPTIDTITPGLNQLSVTFSQSIVGTTPTRYYYSTNGTTPLGSGTLTSPLLITGISAQYTFYIIASNSAGNISSNTTGTGTPYLVGSTPSLSVDSSTNSLILTYSQSSGGNPSETYYYSIDGSFVSIGSYISPYKISELYTDISRNIYVGARGYDIVNNVIWDISSATIRKSPYVFGSNPTASLVSGVNKLTVTYSQLTAGTSTTTFYYSLNGGGLVAASASPFDISGLTSTSPYSLYVLARNPAGDISSNSVTGNVFGSKPTTSLVSGVNKLTVTYLQLTAGTDTTAYYYSLNGGGLVAASASPFDISGLTSTSPYSLYVLARNPAGDISSNSVTGNVFGSNPTASLASGVNKLTVTYSQLTVGTSTTTFYYSLNGGGLVAASASPFDILGLTSTSSYSLYVLARNPAGDISSNSVTGNVFGSNPTASLVSGVNKLTVTYSQLTAGTSATAFYYSLNGGGLVETPASPFDISGLTSTSPYSLYVLARNPAGDISSNSVTGNVFGSKPTVSLASGVNKLTVTYSQLTVGTSTTTYYYSLNGGGLVETPSSPFEISGLTSTSPYSLYVLARNPAGDISSNLVTGNVIGSKPTVSLASGVNKLTVTYSQLTAGTSATTFYYSLNGGDLVAAPESPFDISGLTTATELSLYVLARNPGGDISSNLVNATPYVLGTKPVISNTIPGTNKITVQFTGSLYGYPEPTYYYSYSADGSNRVGPVVSPFDISNVTTTKTVYIVASNIAGNIISDGSEVIPYVIGSAPIINRIISGVNSLVVDFAGSTGGYPSPSTYLYSLDGGAYINANTALSPFLISNLTTAKSYAVRLIARNAGGDTNASNSISETPQIITGGSGYGTKVTPATYWRSNYWRRR